MELLADSALADREGVPRLRQPSPVGKHPLASVGIAAVRLPGGGCVNLMRVMQTNACSLSCGYCPTFRGGNVPRVSISPDETARTFMDVHRKGLASGLFLTSGVPGRASRATDRMLATLDLLRSREGFTGYVHIKLLPGAEAAQVEEAARLANRISVNLEAPGNGYVHRLTHDKNFSGDLLPKLEYAGRLLAARRGVPGALPVSGATTPVVFPAGGDARVVRGAGAGSGARADDGARAGRSAAHDGIAWSRGSTRRRRRYRACGILPDAARAPAIRHGARGTASAVRARRPSHAGAVPDAGAAVRLSLP